MWLSAIKLAVSAGSKIYANKQKTKMAMSEAQLENKNGYVRSTAYARHKNGRRPGSLPRQIIRGTSVGLEGRGRFDNSQFARVGARLGSRIRRSISYGQSKIVLRHVLSAPVMVHKFVDPCRCEHIWYKGNSNF